MYGKLLCPATIRDGSGISAVGRDLRHSTRLYRIEAHRCELGTFVGFRRLCRHHDAISALLKGSQTAAAPFGRK